MKLLNMNYLKVENYPKDDIANLLTYERNSWGNKGGIVTSAGVTKERG